MIMENTLMVQPNRYLLVSLLLVVFGFSANAQQVVKVNPQKHFPRTVPAGNYSGITHLHDDVYGVVSDKSDSVLYFKFKIEIDSVSGELLSVDNLGPGQRINGKGLDLEAIAKVSSHTIVVASEGKYAIKEFGIDSLLSTGKELWEWSQPTEYFYPNYVFESLAFDARQQRLWTISESTLRRDGKPASPENRVGNKLRLLSFDWSQGNGHPMTASYAYQMDAPTTDKKAQYYVMGVSELCALGDGKLIVLEREAFVPHKKLGAFCHCKLYLVDTSKEQVFPNDEAFDEQTPFVKKKLLTEWTTNLTLLGRSFANYEGMCLGPRLKNGNQVLILLSDSQNQYAGVLRDWFKTIVITDE